MSEINYLSYDRFELLAIQPTLLFRIPVIGVTVVFGTTQEGAVDDLRQVQFH